MIAGSLLWALPPPLMCLHFHPMAVSRWFSAASLKQVSNMAITGSGSLAISLCVFVISAAFLPKGKFGFLLLLFFFFLSHRCVFRDADIYPRMKPVEGECVCVCVSVCVWLYRGVGEVVRCVLRAGCAHMQGLGKSQHHFFYRSRYIRDVFILPDCWPTCVGMFFSVLARWLMGCCPDLVVLQHGACRRRRAIGKK